MAEGEGNPGEGNPQGAETIAKSEYDKLKGDFDNLQTDHGKLKEAADFIGQLQTNPRFTSFMEEENRRAALGDEEYERLYGQQATPQGDEDDFDKLSDEEKISHLMNKVNELEGKVGESEKVQAEERVQSFEKQAQDELRNMMDEEKYPLFQKNITVEGRGEISVRQLMHEEMGKAIQRGQNMSMEQAYKLVTYETQKKLGAEEHQQLLAKKREAARLGVPPTTPGLKPGETPPKFDNPRQAAEWAIEHMES